MQAYIETITKRLDTLNQQRQERSLALMDDACRYVYQLLPAFFHFHHPDLPGFQSAPTPHGVRDFTLQPEHEKAMEAQGLYYLPLIDQHPESHEILGLYTMGSTSSIGQSLSSDLDVWVCVSPAMSAEARQNLTEKCRLISEWALRQGVEASFFVMDSERFKCQQSDEMTGDNCGSSQHLLLLDEFYRSAVRLAGQRLLWLIIPPEMEECYDDYVAYLVESGVLDMDQWLDFGQLYSIPAQEYFGSSLWQLYKSIDSPYKSVLKAILLEAYSWEYPFTQLLSVDTKRRFFAGEPDLYGMDAYYLMLVKVTRYLTQIQDYQRLDLVRRCFYLKTHEKLSREAGRESVSWRRQSLQEMVEMWQWPLETLQELDSRRYWKVEQVQKVHVELLGALMKSYRNLISFARRNEITSAISPQDISILARKLYAAFEVLPSKVTLLNAQISPDLHEPDLSLIQVGEGGVNRAGWYLFKAPLNPHKFIGARPIEQHDYLSKLVAWSFFNGLLTESTRVHTQVKDAELDIDKLYQMVGDLRNTFSLTKRRPSMEALGSPCEISQLAMFINFEQDPTAQLSGKDLKIDLKQVNIFSFGSQQKNLVGSVDLVYRNSWQEVRTMNFKGTTAMIDALKALLGKMHQDAIPPESIDVFCYSKNLRGVMRNMVYQLLAESIDLRLKPIEPGQRRRFKAMRLADKTFGLFFERRGVMVETLENSVDFYRSISSSKLKGSPLMMLDKEQAYELPDVVDCYASEGLVQFFFEDTDDGFNIYILDEANRVEAYHQFTGSKDDMIANVNNFYTTIQDEHQVSAQFINFNLPQYYQIIHQGGQAQVIPYRNCARPESAAVNQ